MWNCLTSVPFFALLLRTCFPTRAYFPPLSLRERGEKTLFFVKQPVPSGKEGVAFSFLRFANSRELLFFPCFAWCLAPWCLAPWCFAPEGKKGRVARASQAPTGSEAAPLVCFFQSKSSNSLLCEATRAFLKARGCFADQRSKE
jgi:hypothetical protein